MKKLFILSAVVAASLIATTGYSQVYVNAHVGFRVPGVRVVAPVYDEYTPAPVYQDGYAPAPVGYESDYPGYTYYNYPAWEGHYRDRFYYAHYRPVFERDHSAYFDRGRFDRGRFENDHGRVASSRGGFENNRGRFEGNRGRSESGRADHRGRR